VAKGKGTNWKGKGGESVGATVTTPNVGDRNGQDHALTEKRPREGIVGEYTGEFIVVMS